MAHPVAIPKLGLTMTDCTLVGWAKEDGDRVERGEVLYSIETDKITSDIESAAEGFLRRLAAVDTMHEVGAVIGSLHPTREAAMAAAEKDLVAPTISPPAVADERPPRRVRVSPLARRVAADAGIDPSILVGTGAGGAVLRRDVDAEIGRQTEFRKPLPPVTEAPAPPSRAVAAPMAASVTEAVTGVAASRRPLAGMRRAIAQKMIQSLQTTAQMTGFGKVDMSESVRMRNACLQTEGELGVRVSYTDIVLKACAGVLAAMPEMNASIIGDEIVTWGEVNVGLAVALDDGLIVPVIRNADRKTTAEIAHERIDLAARARAGNLRRDDMEGGTFSLSNFGSYGGDFETPILNAPQSALLGIGAITEEAVVHEGQIVIRPMMTISLTFDHRLIDGAVAGRFRTRLRSALETPYSMMARMR